MVKNFTKYLNTTLDIPDVIIELDNFRKSKNSNPRDLSSIIKSDKNLYQDMIKIINYDIFDFKGKQKNIPNFTLITSLEFVTTLATALSLTQTLKQPLFAYAVSVDDFLYSNTLAIRVVDIWIGKIDKKLRNELLFPAFLQEISKPIISMAISENKLTEKFLNHINTYNDISLSEEKFTGYKSARVSANILKKWDLSHNIILPIAFAQDLDNCPYEFRQKAMILDIIKQLCNLREPLSDNSIQKALEKISSYDFDIEIFLLAIDEIKSNSFGKI